MAVTTPTAREIPEVRADLAAWAADRGRDGMANWLHCMLPPAARTSFDDLLPPGITTPQGLAARTAAGLRAAELFYVTSDMTALAHHAAESLTDFEMRPEDLPAPVGMLAFEDPPLRYEAAGNQSPSGWSPGGPGSGTWPSTTGAAPASTSTRSKPPCPTTWATRTRPRTRRGCASTSRTSRPAGWPTSTRSTGSLTSGPR
ncbi:hypothetical protein [Streptomyces sp. NPDC052535]|uniref:hypothetical protein n=1 Tax=Streptomyces sp. NPDC052535 TaxID=3155531 RepID=UPI00342F2815